MFSFPSNLFLELLVFKGEPEVLDVVLLHPAVAGDLDGDVDQVVQLVGHPVGLGRGRITVATDGGVAAGRLAANLVVCDLELEKERSIYFLWSGRIFEAEYEISHIWYAFCEGAKVVTLQQIFRFLMTYCRGGNLIFLT